MKLEVRNYQLPDRLASADVVGAEGVGGGYRRLLECGEGGADLEVVVDRQDELASDAGQLLGQGGEIGAAEDAWAVIRFAAPVGRI